MGEVYDPRWELRDQVSQFTTQSSHNKVADLRQGFEHSITHMTFQNVSVGSKAYRGVVGRFLHGLWLEEHEKTSSERIEQQRMRSLIEATCRLTKRNIMDCLTC